jgi:hypothetical protein
MGALTHSRLDRAVIARYFFFLVISQLVIFTLIGVIFSGCPRFSIIFVADMPRFRQSNHSTNRQEEFQGNTQQSA